MALINVAELTDMIADGPRPVIVDVRWGLAAGALRDEYLAGHIERAVFLDFDAELCGPPGENGRHPLPRPDRLQASLRAAGIHNDSPVVVYDGGDMLAAGRTWWTLRWAGVDDVHVLDGGIESWRRNRQPVTTEVFRPGNGTVVVQPGQLPVLGPDDAARHATEEVLIDVRTAARFDGEPNKLDPVPGHIPDAVNLPAGQTMNPDGTGLAPIAQLRDRFAPYRGAKVGVYCGSGVTAARTALAMVTAGEAMPSLYVGSWSEWSLDPARPVAAAD